MPPAASPDRGGLADAFASPEAKRRHVRRLFGTIADRYDFITRFLSVGRDRAWKARLVALSGIRASDRALDLACGTGDIAFALAAGGARVIGLDLTQRMLELAMVRRARDGRAAFVTGDMTALPFPDGSFEIVTTGYGIRNVPRIEPVLAEIHRVLRPGGVVLSLDFDRPRSAPLRAIYLGYLTVVGSCLGWALHRDPDTYRYIPESIRRYPGATGVAAMLAAAGFAESRALRLFGGLMAINIARRGAVGYDHPHGSV